MRGFDLHHPFRIFGKFLLENFQKLLDESEIEFFYANCLSTGTQYIHKLLSKHVDSLDNLIANTKGKFILFCQEPEEQPLLDYQDLEVCQLTFIYPSALSILEQVNYIQLDASFKAIDSLVYSVILGIISNESFPIGLQISPTEKALHYSTFFKEITEHFPSINLSKLHYLSDQGKGLIKFVQSVGGKHHFCYRHILENLGSDSFAAIIVHQLLWCSTLEEFSIALPQALADLHQLAIMNALTENQISIITQLFGLDFLDSFFFVRDENNISFTQALWSRKKKEFQHAQIM
jgi:hypothetical protein